MHPEVVFVACVGDKDITVVAETHCLRIVEPGTRCGATPKCVAPIISPSTCNRRKRHCSLPLHLGIAFHHERQSVWLGGSAALAPNARFHGTRAAGWPRRSYCRKACCM